MRILAVSNSLTTLLELNEIITKVYPEADVIKVTDPLMACKYSFNNEVDFMFADENMKRMNGLDLAQFVKRERPEVKTYLIAKRKDASGSLIYAADDIIMTYVFSVEGITEILKKR